VADVIAVAFPEIATEALPLFVKVTTEALPLFVQVSTTALGTLVVTDVRRFYVGRDGLSPYLSRAGGHYISHVIAAVGYAARDASSYVGRSGANYTSRP
jgi:hypothetical protein